LLQKIISAVFGYRNSLWVFFFMISTTVHFCFVWVCILSCFILVNKSCSLDYTISKETSHMTAFRQKVVDNLESVHITRIYFILDSSTWLRWSFCIPIIFHVKLSIFASLKQLLSFNILGFHNILGVWSIKVWAKSHYMKFAIPYGLVLIPIFVYPSHSLLIFINHYISRLWFIRNGLY